MGGVTRVIDLREGMDGVSVRVRVLEAGEAVTELTVDLNSCR